MIFGAKNLGFGLMRLPILSNGDVDIEQVQEMVDKFLDSGFNYFDTAFGYMDGKSEEIFRQVVAQRHPRDSFLLADKMPLWEVNSSQDLEKIFNLQLQRTGAEYFDYYLLHSLYDSLFQKAEKFDAWDFLKQKKAQGKIKHIGFSFHDNAKCLERILQRYDDCEFVQLQINYADWDSEIIQSRLCLETARNYNKPVIVMEPVKGGSLSALPTNARDLLLKAEPDWSIPSWAIRFATMQDGVEMVLSGMSDLSQLNDNIKIFNNLQHLGNDQIDVIDKVVEILNSIPTIQCTDCKYCLSNCPQNIPIPEIIKLLNIYNTYCNLSGPKKSYGWAVEGSSKASDCVSCGNCEKHCPQHLEIINALKKSAKLFEN